ncbi:acyltransferase [Thermodesulfobacteriota bacterium]
MSLPQVTMTAEKLEETLEKIVRRPHKKIHKGKVVISPDVYRTPGKETNVFLSPYSFLDCTGSIRIGPWCMFGARSRIYTHDHIHTGKRPLLEIQEAFGIVWQDKYIGADVWIHDNALILYQATFIPDGVVLGAGSILTKNPGPYEIWAGAPAKKVGERADADDGTIERILKKDRFLLPD